VFVGNLTSDGEHISLVLYLALCHNSFTCAKSQLQDPNQIGGILAGTKS